MSKWLPTAKSEMRRLKEQGSLSQKPARLFHRQSKKMAYSRMSENMTKWLKRISATHSARCFNMLIRGAETRVYSTRREIIYAETATNTSQTPALPSKVKSLPIMVVAAIGRIWTLATRSLDSLPRSARIWPIMASRQKMALVASDANITPKQNSPIVMAEACFVAREHFVCLAMVAAH